MTERDVLSRVDQLVDEEHRLRGHAEGRGLSDDERARLSAVEAELDQCWDLLRQRRARAEYGDDPEAAAARPVSEVEDYLQ